MAEHEYRTPGASDLWDPSSTAAPRPRGSAAPAAPAGDGGLAPEAANPHKNVVYLGFNIDKNAREIESKAVKEYAAQHHFGAGILTGNGGDKSKEGVVSWTDQRTGKPVEYDLRTAEGLRGYMHFLDIDQARPEEMKLGEDERKKAIDGRMKAIEDIFRGKDNGNGVREGGIMMDARDEIGQYLEVLQMVQMGYMSMDRLVLSGHSNGSFIYSEEGETSPGINYKKLAALTALFPKAQNGIKDIMFSACHTDELYQKDGETVADTRNAVLGKMIAPKAGVHWGYNGRSPAAGEAANHITRGFLPSTEKNDDLEAAIAAARRSGGNAKAE